MRGDIWFGHEISWWSAADFLRIFYSRWDLTRWITYQMSEFYNFRVLLKFDFSMLLSTHPMLHQFRLLARLVDSPKIQKNEVYHRWKEGPMRIDYPNSIEWIVWIIQHQKLELKLEHVTRLQQGMTLSMVKIAIFAQNNCVFLYRTYTRIFKLKRSVWNSSNAIFAYCFPRLIFKQNPLQFFKKFKQNALVWRYTSTYKPKRKIAAWPVILVF